MASQDPIRTKRHLLGAASISGVTIPALQAKLLLTFSDKFRVDGCQGCP